MSSLKSSLHACNVRKWACRRYISVVFDHKCCPDLLEHSAVSLYYHLLPNTRGAFYPWGSSKCRLEESIPLCQQPAFDMTRSNEMQNSKNESMMMPDHLTQIVKSICPLQCARLKSKFCNCQIPLSMVSYTMRAAFWLRICACSSNSFISALNSSASFQVLFWADIVFVKHTMSKQS
jgi:hypothetical protein